MKTIRGAITVDADTEDAVRDATIELFNKIKTENNLENCNVESIIFSCTADIRSAYPAKFLREEGLVNATLLCTQEMHVENSLEHCIRMLIFAQIDYTPNHVYLRNAEILRPDITWRQI